MIEWLLTQRFIYLNRRFCFYKLSWQCLSWWSAVKSESERSKYPRKLSHFQPVLKLQHPRLSLSLGLLPPCHSIVWPDSQRGSRAHIIESLGVNHNMNNKGASCSLRQCKLSFRLRWKIVPNKPVDYPGWSVSESVCESQRESWFCSFSHVTVMLTSWGENRQRDGERSNSECHRSASGTYSVDVVGWPQKRTLSKRQPHHRPCPGLGD